MVKEIFSGGGIVGVSQFGGSELGVERDGFFKMRKRVVGKQSFGKIASLEKFLAGFVGLGRDRDLWLLQAIEAAVANKRPALRNNRDLLGDMCYSSGMRASLRYILLFIEESYGYRIRDTKTRAMV
ncbi:MAG: hypothetical protein DMG71_04190 [Acidobacteria bacterium]|nr:MAG: hypothetical protein DMG71_04190 [Acidobacteriota bacterium]